MKERPILFSAPMVRAILAGTKTQTRRVVKPQPDNDPAKHHPIEPYTNGRGNWNWVLAATGHGTGDPFPCPYGQPGDQLWVREAWSTHACFDAIPPRDLTTRSIAYAADGPIKTGKLRPGMFMPRWASRITLEVTGVRVERLQDISEADARAEGAQAADPCDHARRSCADIGCGGPQDYRGGYRTLWEQINGAGSWAANPWVWVVSFRVIEP
jgi:hypothetical protein